MQGESAEGERRKQIEGGVQGLQSRGPAAGPDREASPLQPVCLRRGVLLPPTAHRGTWVSAGSTAYSELTVPARREGAPPASRASHAEGMGATAIYSGVEATPNASKSQPKKYANESYKGIFRL